MSAPTAVESGALLSGLAWRVQPTPQRNSSGVHRERRSQHPLAVLSRTHDDVCRQACDPLEIAAVLEAGGLSDRQARHSYQSAGVFEVAESLWEVVPWRSAAVPPRRDLWRLPLWRALLRGLLYALPAVLYVAALRQMPTGLGLATLVAATILPIGAGQSLSILGHILLGRGQRGAASDLLRVALGTGALLALIVGAFGTWAFGSAVPGLLCGGQLLYTIAATMLMVSDNDILLLAVLLPGLLLLLLPVVTAGVLGAPVNSVVIGILAITVLVAAAAADIRLRSSYGDRLWQVLGQEELVAAGLGFLYGVGVAGIASFIVLDVVTGRANLSGVHISLAMLPVTATLGVGEYLLHRARSRTASGLSRAQRVSGFAQGCRAELRRTVFFHAATVTAVAAGVLAAVHGDRDEALLAVHTMTYAVLSVALLLHTTLLSLGFYAMSAGLVGSGAVVDCAIRATAGLSAGALAIAHLLVVSALAVAAYRLAARRFTDPLAHR